LTEESEDEGPLAGPSRQNAEVVSAIRDLVGVLSRVNRSVDNLVTATNHGNVIRGRQSQHLLALNVLVGDWMKRTQGEESSDDEVEDGDKSFRSQRSEAANNDAGVAGEAEAEEEDEGGSRAGFRPSEVGEGGEEET